MAASKLPLKSCDRPVEALSTGSRGPPLGIVQSALATAGSASAAITAPNPAKRQSPPHPGRKLAHARR